MKSGEALIDLMAILPAYLNFFVRIDLRMLRILRLLRLLKLTRYFISLQILLCVIKREKRFLSGSDFYFNHYDYYDCLWYLCR